MTVLQVADLRFGYAGDTLFAGVTFSLELGERVALVAPNGSGKTTLLRLLAGELEPDEGSVVLRRDATLMVPGSSPGSPARGCGRRDCSRSPVDGT